MRSFVLLAALLAGCGLYLPHGGEDDICTETGAVGKNASLRDPTTNTCQIFGSTGPTCGCGVPCDPTGVVLPNWGECTSTCTGLDEATCLATAGCQGAFILPISTPAGLPPITPAFTGCWATPTPPLHGGTCAGLTADVCTRHDDCGAVYIGPTNGQTFTQCIPEPNQTACDSVGTEGDCKLRADCVPLYQGTDCTCTPSTCTCATETYERCESAPGP